MPLRAHLPSSRRCVRIGVVLALLFGLFPSASHAAVGVEGEVATATGCQALATCRGGACIASTDASGKGVAHCTGPGFPALGRLEQTELYVRGQNHKTFSLLTTIERETGLAVRYVRLRGKDGLSFGGETVRASDLLSGLGLYGAVAVFEEPDAPAGWRDAVLTFRMWGRTADEIALTFTELFGTNVTFHPDDPTRLFHLSARHVRGEDALAYLARLGRVTVGGEDVAGR